MSPVKDFSSTPDSVPDPLQYFSGRSEDYEKYRPVHPTTAIDTLLADLKPPTQLVAVDVGAGTGIGARLLADRGVEVLAIEPNADMRSAATAHPGVEFRAGTAEAVLLKNASVDLVTSFQAFHWFEFKKSLQEFRRVFKPGGRLALVWSLWDQSDAVSKEYNRLIMEASRDKERQSPPRRSMASAIKSFRYQLFWQDLYIPYFNGFRRCDFRFNQSLDVVGLVGLAHSQGVTPAQRPALDQLISELSNFYHLFCDIEGQVQLAYQTRLYLAASPKKI
ncbi:class I SAM-dependent methyltransferase [Nodosilinea sp. LEGE 07088]|uniref:class I SAM-dependent methyltransferase n=1 Tax=Nodosilinea sp. LEGE 07088 TaxID=2777968 RepID=UPI001881A621|nr:class I SAM-dependent methyltransferase [Nodosilinea sp. LEGE 07088]MBE9140822.1 class I SAM-dependent methyltransferase [Nodosilinea sp. LEGE 07088]